MKYKIADLIVEFDTKYEMLKKRSEKYRVNNSNKTNVKLIITDEVIEKGKLEDPNLTNELSEYLVTGGTFYKSLIQYNGCLLHASSVVVNDEAYLFSAPCGTGKSTHTSLWMKYLKDKNPYILNDDKPAIRIIDNEIYAYGTPFCGKDDINENKKVKLKGICFLEQSTSNSIQKIEPSESINLFLEQTVRNLEKSELLKFFDILDTILKEIPIYKLYCDISEEAVQLSYQTMKGENTNEN